jgi:orotidine-5'-phosphate decarboxylase
MNKTLTPSERLIVSVDSTTRYLAPRPYKNWIAGFIQELKEFKICVKLESSLRLFGFSFIPDVQEMGFRVFADLKLYGTPSTLNQDACHISHVNPRFVTICGQVSEESMSSFKRGLISETEIIGVPLLTTQDEDFARKYYEISYLNAYMRFASILVENGVKSLICPPDGQMIRHVRRYFRDDISIICPGIRFPGREVTNDDQINVFTRSPRQAIKSGADYIVVGRPITSALDSRLVVEEIIRDIEMGLADRDPKS